MRCQGGENTPDTLADWLARHVPVARVDGTLPIGTPQSVTLTREQYDQLLRNSKRPGHHPPCPAMFDSEAVCTCGQ
jgi:hypothetical protein